MAPVIATTIIKDGGGTNIAGGVTTLEKTGDGTTGPFTFINILGDGTTGTTLATIKKASVSAAATDPGLVVSLHPLSNFVAQTAVWTTVVSGTTFISGGNVTAVVGGTTFISGGTVTAVVSGTTSITGVVSVTPPLTISTTNTPTLATTNAYTATQVVGGILTFTSVLGTATSGIIQSITCKFNTGVMTTGLSVSIFKAAPSGTFTDHVAAAVNTADIPSLIGTYRLSTALSDLGNHAIYNLDGIGKAFSSATSNVYGVVTSLGTTLALGNVTTFSVELGVLPG